MSGVSAVPAGRASMKGVYQDPIEPGRNLVRKKEGVSGSGMVAFSVQGDPGTTVNIPKGEKLTKVDILA